MLTTLWHQGGLYTRLQQYRVVRSLLYYDQECTTPILIDSLAAGSKLNPLVQLISPGSLLPDLTVHPHHDVCILGHMYFGKGAAIEGGASSNFIRRC